MQVRVSCASGCLGDTSGRECQQMTGRWGSFWRLVCAKSRHAGSIAHQAALVRLRQCRGHVQAARLGLVADRDAQSAALLQKLLRLALRRLSEQYVNGEFVFTVTGETAPDGGWLLKPTGTSIRYGAIAALGLRRVTGSEQCTVLAGQTYDDLVGHFAPNAWMKSPTSVTRHLSAGSPRRLRTANCRTPWLGSSTLTANRAH